MTKNTDMPKYHELMNPLLQAMHESGGLKSPKKHNPGEAYSTMCSSMKYLRMPLNG